MVASQTFDSIIQQILTSNLNFQLQMSPFSANISLKKTPIKDRYGAPICLPPSLPSHPQVKTEVNEPKNDIVNLDTNANQKYRFPFPPPGFPFPQPQTQSKVCPKDDTKYAPPQTDLYRDYCELELEFEHSEGIKKALEKEIESERKTAEDVEHKNSEIEKDLLAFKMENNVLTENIKDLEFDITKIKGDYNEYQHKCILRHQ